MAKKLVNQIKLQIPAGKANPAPPVGPALGQAGVNIQMFCKEFNARTQALMSDNMVVPVVISVFADRSFSFVTKTPPAAGGVLVTNENERSAKTEITTGTTMLSDIRACVRALNSLQNI